MFDFIALDFETAQGKRYSACAIGIVAVKNNVITEKFWSLIQPPCNEYAPYNINVHKITPEMTEYAPTFEELYPSIKHYFQGNNVVCHNADFDLDVLRQTMQYYGIVEELNIIPHCTLRLYGRKLDICCAELNIALDHHNALSDAEACAKLFLIFNNFGSIYTDMREDMGSYKISVQFSSSPQKIKGDVMKKELGLVEKIDNPFYNKKVVISGTYEYWPDRTRLAELMKHLGADIDANITVNTNFLLAGKDVGPVKVLKMNKNIERGKDSTILTEIQLRQLLNELDL